MKLYHGTSEETARKAVTEGLVTRKTSGRASNWAQVSRPELVYLTTAYAPYFAAAASEDDGRWAVVEVDVDPNNLLPDEDFLEQSTRGLTKPDWLRKELQDVVGMTARTAWFREHLLIFKEAANASLKALGNAAHLGDIAQEQITRVVLFDPGQAPDIAMIAMDPMITLPNYRLCGAKYRELTRWFAGYDADVTEICWTMWPRWIADGREQAAAHFAGKQSALEVLKGNGLANQPASVVRA